jgi:type I restriction enzyme S subunit
MTGTRFKAYPEYKDSGIEWLGEIPAHWEVSPLKHMAYMKGRLGWQNLKADEYTDEGPFLVASEQFESDAIQWDRCPHVTQERYKTAPEIQLREQDVLFMKDGAAMGKTAYIDSLPGDACLSSHLLLLRPVDSSFLPRFLYYIFKSPIFKIYMKMERTGTTFFGFKQESMGNYPFFIVPRPEQNEIIDYLDRKTAKIDALISKIQEAIERLKEYRTALISAAVTGKIDVRGEAKNQASGDQ